MDTRLPLIWTTRTLEEILIFLQLHNYDTNDVDGDETESPIVEQMNFTDRGLVAVGPTTMRGGLTLPRLPQRRPPPPPPNFYGDHANPQFKHKKTQTVDTKSKPALRDLFLHYARFSEPHSMGHHITLAQSDKVKCTCFEFVLTSLSNPSYQT